MPRLSPARSPLLGGATPASFLRRHWQKDALLIRGAIPDFVGLHTRTQLFALAQRDDVESRLLVREGRRWTMEHGPFPARVLRGLPATQWTLLVQGVNLHCDAADALLRRFAFLPFARLDDLMVSYAAPGGGVGPHFDSYDVFLLQGFGRRRWRYGRQDDLSLRPGLPVKILQRFVPAHDAVLEPGDMLYLPPAFAHDGIAVDACTTYSIGFRAASHQELAEAFFDWLRDEVKLPGRYTDPAARPTPEPARVGATMVREAAAALARARWNRAAVARFLGAMLSEPKSHVVFEAPAGGMSRARIDSALRRHGVKLDRRTQWLYDDVSIFLNGNVHPWPAGDRQPLMQLANLRALPASAVPALSADARAFLHQAHDDGYLHTG
ncbi:MAG: cupin domain-containing protein [Casimicrobiaceae bacterium]